MVATAAPFNERFAKLIRGHWLDSIGNSIIVSKCSEEEELTAVLTPLIDHPDARDRILKIKQGKSRQWRCGNANLEWMADEQQQRLVWVTDDGKRSVWSRNADLPGESTSGSGSAFPWLLNNAMPEPWLPLDVPRDILYDGARVAALLDIRQMIGPRSEPQERLTHILMDHDLHPMRGDYLIPGAESLLWQTLPVSDSMRRSIAQRIHRIPHEALSQRVSWSGESEVWVGHHKISCRARDIRALESRWVLPPKDERKPLEIARLLALYSVFDNPLSNRRSGVHLGLDPELRRHCDYELFASPLNAAVSNGRFASKWPHVEWRFGSIGAYPSVLSFLPVNSVVCVNPPFTEAYLADVMARLAELKLRFRLRIAVPIQEVPWRKKLQSSLPSAQLLRTYYDASSESHTDVLHPTLLWEDPRCPLQQEKLQQQQQQSGSGPVSACGSPLLIPSGANGVLEMYHQMMDGGSLLQTVVGGGGLGACGGVAIAAAALVPVADTAALAQAGDVAAAAAADFVALRAATAAASRCSSSAGSSPPLRPREQTPRSGSDNDAPLPQRRSPSPQAPHGAGASAERHEEEEEEDGDPEAPPLDAHEWPALSLAKGRKSSKMRR